MTQPIILIAVIVFLVIVGGTSFALAKPGNTFAAPFRGAAITVVKTSYETIGLFEHIYHIVAAYERNILSITLQSMRVIEDLEEVPPVMVPTNDMARFPSAEYPLFPKYVDKRFSQFKYTVDSDGIINIRPSGATTDVLIDKIEQLLNQQAEKGQNTIPFPSVV